jgi:hypothetical protein
VMASVVPAKGSNHQLPVRRMRAFLSELGHQNLDVSLKSDQELAIKDLMNEGIKLRTTARTMKEESPVGSSASNGVIERGVQTIEGHIRVLKDGRLGRPAEREDPGHPSRCGLDGGVCRSSRRPTRGRKGRPDPLRVVQREEVQAFGPGVWGVV